MPAPTHLYWRAMVLGKDNWVYVTFGVQSMLGLLTE